MFGVSDPAFVDWSIGGLVDGFNDFIKLGFIACSLELVALFLEFSEIFIEVVVARLSEFLRLSQQGFDDSLNEIIS